LNGKGFLTLQFMIEVFLPVRTQNKRGLVPRKQGMDYPIFDRLTHLD